MNTCNLDCTNLDKKQDRCSKYNCILPRNPYNNILKCDNCKEEQNESKNKT